MDFLWAKDAPKLVYEYLMNHIRRFRIKPSIEPKIEIPRSGLQKVYLHIYNTLLISILVFRYIQGEMT